MESSARLQIGLLAFPNVQQLDLTGPYEVFASWPGARVRLVGKTLEPVISSTGLWLKPDASFDDCPQLDVICVPGGFGINALMADEATLAFVRRQAEGARFVTSVCTGALVLGAAGLLKGKRATTHWASHHLLATLGAIPVQARVVRDGRLVTGGGVTAGIDFALTLLAELAGRGSRRSDRAQPRICARAAVQCRQPRDGSGGDGRGSAQAPGADRRGTPTARGGGGAEAWARRLTPWAEFRPCIARAGPGRGPREDRACKRPSAAASRLLLQPGPPPQWSMPKQARLARLSQPRRAAQELARPRRPRAARTETRLARSRRARRPRPAAIRRRRG